MKTNDRKSLIVFCIAMILLFAMALSGCGKRPTTSVQQATDTTKETAVSNTDTAITTNTNGAINDKLNIYIPPVKTAKADCDSICDLFVSNLMEQMNRDITSGNNRYQVLYDKYKRQLQINANLAETADRSSEVKRDRFFVRDRIITNKITTTIPVPYAPWYYKYPAYFGWACGLFIIGYLFKMASTWIQKKSSLS